MYRLQFPSTCDLNASSGVFPYDFFSILTELIENPICDQPNNFLYPSCVCDQSDSSTMYKFKIHFP